MHIFISSQITKLCIAIKICTPLKSIFHNSWDFVFAQAGAEKLMKDIKKQLCEVSSN